MAITIFGYLLTVAFLVSGNSNEIVNYLYFGFLLVMCYNAIFPHLIATIILKKYAPGTLTGLFLNLPIGLYIVFWKYGEQLSVYKLIIGFAVTAVVMLASLRPLFKLGKKLIDEY